MCITNSTTSCSSLLTVSISQLSSASLHILFILQFISTHIFKIFLHFFLKKDSEGKSPFLWEKPSEFIPCQMVGPRSAKTFPFTGIHSQNILSSLFGLMCKKCKRLESSCSNQVDGSLIFYSDVLQGKKSLATS